METDKLWFISENGVVINLFDDKERASEERFYLKEENPLDRYKLYELALEDLEDYPEEKEFATMLGYFDKRMEYGDMDY